MKKSTKPAAVKPPKRIAELYARARADEKMSQKDKAELEAWSLKRLHPEQRDALWTMAWALVLDPKPNRPAEPPSVPIETQHAILAKRLEVADEAIDNEMPELYGLRDMFASAATLVGELDYLSDDGPGLETKKRAVMSAVKAMGQAGATNLTKLIGRLDALKMGQSIKPEDVEEFEAPKEAATETAEAA